MSQDKKSQDIMYQDKMLLWQKTEYHIDKEPLNQIGYPDKMFQDKCHRKKATQSMPQDEKPHTQVTWRNAICHKDTYTLACLINLPPLLEISKRILKIGRILVKKINFLKSKKAFTKTECSKSMNWSFYTFSTHSYTPGKAPSQLGPRPPRIFGTPTFIWHARVWL